MNKEEIKDEIQDRLDRTSKYMKSLFPMQQYIEEAEAIIEDCFERHDVPKLDHPRVRDLNDRYGDGLVNANGFPVSGIIAQEDFHVGGDSPAVPIVIGMIGFVWGLCKFLALIHLPTIALLAGFVYALFLFNVTSPDFRKFGKGAFLTALIFVPVVGGIYYAFTHLGTFGVAGMTGEIHDPFGSLATLLGSSAFSLVLAFAPILVPYWYSRKKYRDYVLSLADVGMTKNGPVCSNLRPHKEARIMQMANGLKDETYFNQVGTATSELASRGDSFAPDEGLAVGQTLQDQRKHGFFFGDPGTGKTTALKNIMAGVIKGEIYDELIEARKKANPGLSYLEITAKHEDQIRQNVDKIFAERIANKK
ncbi:hypothetical protein F7R25_03830 [Burkholderia stagnalis]|uniref:Uncharacterized protein n=1 Tax=Burkholderia stagnalis TaxID=1503054 RepID=A0A6L3N3Y2_9BURK|nr:hypothetical protein [Burkholderia stagnalis]KAB0640634.1 hypothetical protein F7R25_03830 [Burkholderia stagnalis]VWB05766.1 hypothetical protein BST28156_00083 [Burkholderia stagnalis]